jgi:hypothetical protein
MDIYGMGCRTENSSPAMKAAPLRARCASAVPRQAMYSACAAAMRGRSRSAAGVRAIWSHLHQQCGV